MPLSVNQRQKDPGEPPDSGGAKQIQDISKEVSVGGETNRAGANPESEKPKTQSFKEKLLETKEMASTGLEKDEELVENRWYQYQKEEEEIAKCSYVYDPCPEIRVSESELATWSEPWKEALVVTLLGKRVSFKMLENKLNRDWARKGKIQLTDLPKNFFVVQFSSPEDYKHALFEGPWMLADHYLLVQRWRPFFITNATVESKVAVWVRIPELPLELYNDRFLWRVGAKLGCLLKIDRLTSIQSRGQFARICVEIDLSKKLVPSIMVRGVVLKLEYEGLHIVCFACGKYGHKQDNCPEIQIQVVEEKKLTEAGGDFSDVQGSLETNPNLVKSGEQGSHGLLATGHLLLEDKRREGQAESDRFAWLTVKKVNRYKVANKKARTVDREQDIKNDVIGKSDPKVETTGSRFAILDENTKPVGIKESSQETKMLIQEEIVKEAEVGPTPTPLGHAKDGKSSKIRNSTGGKNTQGSKRGKEYKPSNKALGPKPKHFTTKVSKSPLHVIEGQHRGKKESHQSKAQFVFMGNSLSVEIKEKKGMVTGEKPVSAFAEKTLEKAVIVGKEEMDWKGVDSLGDSDVLRDLHLGIQNFHPTLDQGNKGNSSDPHPSMIEEASAMQVSPTQKDGGLVEKDSESCSGSGMIQNKLLSL